jgi:DNA (cytosine-5)-methyltransferase 1
MKKYLSLFSGIGGLDEGLHRVGFTPLFCSELDDNAFATLEQWCIRKSLSPLMNRDINQVDPRELIETLNIKPGDLDLLAGGPPCQAFSLIGKRRSLEDDRGVLLLKMVEFAKIFRPKAVLIEQVKGLLSARGADGKPGGALRSILEDLESLGYSTNYKVLRAADYGVPQLRDRVFIVAIQSTVPFNFPDPTHFPPKVVDSSQGELLGRLSPYCTVKDVIIDLPKPVKKGETETFPSHLDITPARDRERINGVPEGECLARQLHLPIEQRMRLDAKKDTTKFRRLAWNLPSLTLRGGEAFYHPIENRYLTPREYMRLHGFPDDHLLCGPIKGRSGTFKHLDQHRLVANAVPPKLAEVIGEEILKQVLRSSRKAA